MSYDSTENIPDIFDNLADSKYNEGADEDLHFSRYINPRHTMQHTDGNVKTAKGVKPVKSHDDIDDDDIEAFAQQVESNNIRELKDKLQTLNKEIDRWTTVRDRAVSNNLDAKKISKVTAKIASLKTEIAAVTAELRRQPDPTATSRMIDKIVAEIQNLQNEHDVITNKIGLLEDKLASLSASATGARRAAPGAKKDALDTFDDDAEMESISKTIKERRASALRENQFGGDDSRPSHGVRIKNPSNPSS